jgi:hypothetical protein
MEGQPYKYEIFETENETPNYAAHNILIERVLKEGWDYLWTVDADVVANVDAFALLMDDLENGADGAFGAYDNEIYRKHKDEIKGSELYKGLLIAGRFKEHPIVPYAFDSLYVKDIEGKVIADPRVFGGNGMSLFKRRIFETGLKQRFVPGGPGNDLVFQAEAWSAGFKLVLDGRVICEHLD